MLADEVLALVGPQEDRAVRRVLAARGGGALPEVLHDALGEGARLVPDERWQVHDDDRALVGHLRHDVGRGTKKIGHRAGEKRIDQRAQRCDDVAAGALVALGEGVLPIFCGCVLLALPQRVRGFLLHLEDGAEAKGVRQPFEVVELGRAPRRGFRHLQDVLDAHLAVRGPQRIDGVGDQRLDAIGPERVALALARLGAAGRLGDPHEEGDDVADVERSARRAAGDLVLQKVEAPVARSIENDERPGAARLGAVALPQGALLGLGAKDQATEPGAQHRMRHRAARSAGLAAAGSPEDHRARAGVLQGPAIDRREAQQRVLQVKGRAAHGSVSLGQARRCLRSCEAEHPLDPPCLSGTILATRTQEGR